MKKFAIYARRSEEKETGESVPNQLNACKQYINSRQKNVIIDEYFDDDYSGRNMNRPDFSNMMKLARKGYYEAIIFWKLDRVARNALEFLELHNELEKIGVNVVSVTEGFDPSTPAGKMMMTMLAAVAEMERKNTSQRVTANMNEMAKKGIWTGGTVPFGYSTTEIDGNKYLIQDKEEIEIAIELFKKYLSTESLFATSKWLKNTHGLNKQPTSIKRILQNLVYVNVDVDILNYLESKNITLENKDKILNGELNNGLISYGKANKTKDEGVEFRDESEWIVAVGKHKGIISGADYIKIQKVLESKSNSGRRGTGEITFLNGICRCSYCQGYMRTKQKKNKKGVIYRYFVCGKKDTGISECINTMVKIEDVEETVLNKLLNYEVGTIDIKDSTIDTSSLKSNLDKKRRQIKNLIMKMSLDEELEDIFLDEIKTLKKEADEIEKNINEIERNNLLNDVSNYNKEIVMENLKNFKQLFDNCPDMDSKRKLVKSVVKEITIDGINKKIELEPPS